jgi:6-phosphogluconolactonase (cycloisomerase 2 family)
MTMRVRTVLMLMAALAMMALAGCGHYTCSAGFGASTCTGTTPPGGSATAAFVFAVDPAGTIDGLTLDTSAATFTTTPSYTGPTGLPQNTSGQGMVVAQGQYLYALYGGVGEIYGFTINSTGGLTPIANSPFSAAYLIGSTVGGTQAMITNPAGTLLFVIDQSAGAIYTYQIGTGGALTLATNTPTLLPFEPENMATDGLGNFLYVTEIGTQNIPALAGYSINSTTGALTSVSGSPFSFQFYGMEQVEGDPSGAYLIGTTSTVFGDPHLYVFSIAQSGTPNAGAITQVTGSPFTTASGFSPLAIAMQPNAGGNLIYSFSVDNTGTYNPIEGYQLNTSTGALTSIGSPFTALSTGGWGQFDPSGAFLFVYDGTSGALTPFDVGTGGVLTQPITTGASILGFWSVTDPN